MGYLSILMWIKTHYSQNTFTGLEIWNLMFYLKIPFSNIEKKIKILLKSQAGFELITDRFVVFALPTVLRYKVTTMEKKIFTKLHVN